MEGYVFGFRPFLIIIGNDVDCLTSAIRGHLDTTFRKCWIIIIGSQTKKHKFQVSLGGLDWTVDILWLVCWSFIRALDNITWHHITPVTIIQTKENWKEEETDSDTERIWSFYVWRLPVFSYSHHLKIALLPTAGLKVCGYVIQQIKLRDLGQNCSRKLCVQLFAIMLFLRQCVLPWHLQAKTAIL